MVTPRLPLVSSRVSLVTSRLLLVVTLLVTVAGAEFTDWDEENAHTSHHHSHVDVDHKSNDDFFQAVGGDEEHLKEHLEDAFTEEKKQEMTREEERYHFFRVHDVDHSSGLDGQELMKSLLHVNPYQATPLESSWSAEQIRHTAQQDSIHNDRLLAAIVDIIDTTLTKYDWNNDGALDYTEFISGAVNMFSQNSGSEH